MFIYSISELGNQDRLIIIIWAGENSLLEHYQLNFKVCGDKFSRGDDWVVEPHQ
jgi:hypothetical protein